MIRVRHYREVVMSEYSLAFAEETAIDVPFTYDIDGIDNDLRPTKAHRKDAAFDLRASFNHMLAPGGIYSIGCGIRLALPDSLTGLVLARSGLASRGITVANSPGLIDSGYRGEVKALLHNETADDFLVRKGDRIAQLLIISLRLVQLGVVTPTAFGALSSDRGEGGFGSTGH